MFRVWSNEEKVETEFGKKQSACEEMNKGAGTRRPKEGKTSRKKE